MYNKYFQSDNIYNQRSICACLIAYAGFLRSNELLNIRCSDVKFEESHMTTFIEGSKTDIYGDGQWVVIARTESEICPVENFEMFLKWCGFPSNCSDFIFRNMSKTKSGYNVRNGNKALTYTRMRELFIETFNCCLPDFQNMVYIF